MKKMWPVVVVLIAVVALLWIAGTAAIAMDQCEVAGNSYTLTVGGDDCTLNFVESDPIFSPAPQCAGTVNIYSSAWGAVDLDWIVVRNHLTVAGFPAVLRGNGLTVYGIPIGLHTTKIAGKTYMTEREIPTLLFK